MTSIAGQPFWARCGDAGCARCWAAAFLPMEMSKCARLLGRARCPMCGGGAVFIAKQAAGQLHEPGWTADGRREAAA